MKSTATLARENNVKSMRYNTDRDIFENYMTYNKHKMYKRCDTCNIHSGNRI